MKKYKYKIWFKNSFVKGDGEGDAQNENILKASDSIIRGIAADLQLPIEDIVRFELKEVDRV